MEVIILAGGFGTRLQSVVKDVPKPMADINGHPFLKYIIENIIRFDVSKIILSVGYKQDIIKSYFGNSYMNIPIEYSTEEEPLGTGGAIKKAFENHVNGKSAIILNGDTFLDISLETLRTFHYNDNNDISLALIEMKNFDRYGSIELKDNQVISFQEKKYCTHGYINAGVYCMNKNILNNFDLAQKFSFEEFLATNVNKLNITGKVFEKAYFVDIGIPSDYKKAIMDFKDKF